MTLILPNMMNLRHSTIGTHHLDSLSCEVFWQTLTREAILTVTGVSKVLSPSNYPHIMLTLGHAIPDALKGLMTGVCLTPQIHILFQ